MSTFYSVSRIIENKLRIKRYFIGPPLSQAVTSNSQDHRNAVGFSAKPENQFQHFPPQAIRSEPPLL